MKQRLIFHIVKSGNFNWERIWPRSHCYWAAEAAFQSAATTPPYQEAAFCLEESSPGNIDPRCPREKEIWAPRYKASYAVSYLLNLQPALEQGTLIHKDCPALIVVMSLMSPTLLHVLEPLNTRYYLPVVSRLFFPVSKQNTALSFVSLAPTTLSRNLFFLYPVSFHCEKASSLMKERHMQ